MIDWCVEPFRILRYDTLFLDWEIKRVFFIECYFSGKVQDMESYNPGDFITNEEGRIYYETDCPEEIFYTYPNMRCCYRIVNERIWGREEGLAVWLKNPDGEEKGYYVIPPICVVGNVHGKNKEWF